MYMYIYIYILYTYTYMYPHTNVCDNICIYIYIHIPPPLEVEVPLLHPSQASPAHAYPMGSNGRPGVSMSRLLIGLQASLAVSVKVRLDAL